MANTFTQNADSRRIVKPDPLKRYRDWPSELSEISTCRYCLGLTRRNEKRHLPIMTTKTTQIFTIDQARAMLPLLRLIVTDISLSHRELTERKSNLRRMLRRHEGSPRFQVYDAEIVEIQEDLKNETAHLEDYISELEQLGVILRSAHDGIVDFPAMIDDMHAFYTWQMEQSDILDYHLADESTAERKPIHN